MRVLHVAPTAFGHDGLFGGGERYPLELARALALVDGVRCELVTFGREARVEEHDGLRIHVLRAVGHLGGHSAHPVAPVTPGDELVLMWVEREHRLAVGLPDTGIAVSERVGERPVERLDAIVERHPRIDPAAVREQFPPAADSREVRGDNNLIRPRLGQRDGGDSDLTRACELDSGGGRRHHLLIMAAGEQAKRHVARVLHAH
jgi:hypothetical protein